MYFLAKLIRSILLKLPLSFCYFLGQTVGYICYLNRRRRKVAFKNIKSAFPERSSKEVYSIVRKSFEGFGLTIIEGMILPRIYKYVVLEESEKSYAGGGIFVGIHAGNWELSVAYWAQKYDFAVFAQQQKHRSIDRFLNELRNESRIKVCFSLKELIRLLKANYMIGVVIDHGAETDALEVKFFSHVVPTPKGGVYLARKFNKRIYPTFAHRRKGFSHILKVADSIDPAGQSDEQVLQRLNKLYEDFLTKYPEEYFWYYKRFKRKANRDVLILSDSKAGHLKQSKALLSILSEEGYSIRSKIVEIKYKNRFTRALADVLSCICRKNSANIHRWLAFLLDKKSWQELDRSYADIIISAGSYVSSVNKLFSLHLRAKSAVILKPNAALSRFDLAVIPKHDRIQKKDVVTIKGALFYPAAVKANTERCRTFFKLADQKKISFFLGGPLTDERLFLQNLKDFIDKFKVFSLNKGYKVLISTSRRTPSAAEDLIAKEFKDFSNTEAIVIANQNNYDFVFEGFADLSDIIFTSSDSISMVSEGASFKKPCICVFFEEAANKHKVFLESLQDDVNFLTSPYDIEVIKTNDSLIFDKNREAIKKEIKRLL